MIGYYVHHHGAGHATRACSIAAALVALGHEVVGFSSLDRPDAWPGDWHVLDRDHEPAPGPDDDVTAGGALHWAPLHHDGYATRMGTIARWVEETRPDAVVVDVSVEVTLLCRLLGVPTVVAAMRGQRDDGPHVLAYDAATTLLAPWPAVLLEPWWPRRWLDKTVHVGGLSRFDHLVDDTPQPGGAGRTGLLLWGRGGTGGPDLDALSAALPDWTWSLPSGSGDEVWDDLVRADVVVCHGGQNAVAEVAAARRPAVVVADPRPFAEQEHTVAALEAGRICATAPAWPEPGQWPGLVRVALDRSGEGWRTWTDGQGARRAAEAIAFVARIGKGPHHTAPQPPEGPA